MLLESLNIGICGNETKWEAIPLCPPRFILHFNFTITIFKFC